jgi:hypothetical protein
MCSPEPQREYGWFFQMMENPKKFLLDGSSASWSACVTSRA